MRPVGGRMTEADLWRKDREKAWLAVLLAWVAGFVDAVGYLSLSHLFLAHMSGNSAAMGAYFGQGRWGAAFHRAFPIPMFVLGVAAGAALNEAASRRGVRSLFSSDHPFFVCDNLETIFREE
jgi:uncharacterized membrane protein YoaK (UPF0700 family)